VLVVSAGGAADDRDRERTGVHARRPGGDGRSERSVAGEPHQRWRASPPQGSGGRCSVVAAGTRRDCAPRLDLGWATWRRKASAAGARALAIVFAGRQKTCLRSRRGCLDCAGCGWPRAAAGSGWGARVVAQRRADRVHRSGGRSRDCGGARESVSSGWFGPRNHARLAAVTDLREAGLQGPELDRAGIQPRGNCLLAQRRLLRVPQGARPHASAAGCVDVLLRSGDGRQARRTLRGAPG
jgi:hypothetical protein